jgi:hypothetical protein
MSCKMRFVGGWVAKRLLAVAGLAMLLPVAAMANSFCQPGSVCVVNNGGTLAGNNSGLTLSGSTISQIGTLFAPPGGNLGSVTFTTGALLTGNLANGTATLSGVGSSFIINESSPGFTGVLFSGSFNGPINWTETGVIFTHGVATGCSAHGGCVYTLSGALSGTWSNGATYYGATTQLTFKSTTPFNGSLTLSQGNTYILTPEPGTLGLMGTGFLGIGLVGLRKMRNKGTQDLDWNS